MMVAMMGYRTVYLAPMDGAVITLETDAAISAVMPKTKLTGEGLQTTVKGSVLENKGDLLNEYIGQMKMYFPHLKRWRKELTVNDDTAGNPALMGVKDHVLPLHKQIYAQYDGDFDRIYSEGYNSKSYQGKVIEPGKVYELSYLECSCPKVKCGLRSNPEQCECSRQSILYILSQLEPESQFDVRLRIRFSEEAIVVLSG